MRFSIPKRFLLYLTSFLLLVSCVAMVTLPAAAGPRTGESGRPLTTAEGGDATEETFEVQMIEEHWAMPDGVRLPVSVYYPRSDPGENFPVVIFVHPWTQSKNLYEALARDYASRGYVGLTYSVRGFYGSEGTIDVIGPTTMKDLSYMITLVSEDGRFPVLKDEKGPVVGVTGYSMGAVHSTLVTERKNPRPSDPGDARVRAVVPWHGGGDILTDVYPGNVLKLLYATGIFGVSYISNIIGFGMRAFDIFMDRNLSPWDKLGSWMAALRDLPPLINDVDPELGWCLSVALQRRMADKDKALDFFKQRSARYWCDEEMDGVVEHPIVTPTLFVAGWNDEIFYVNDNLNMLSCIEAPARLIITDHTHMGGMIGLLINGAIGTELDWIWSEMERWFDHFLKGVDNGVESEPQLLYYGGSGDSDDPGTYSEAAQFPPPSTEYISYYLGAGNLSSKGPASSGPDILLNLGFTGSVSIPNINDMTEGAGFFGLDIPPLDLPTRLKLLQIPFTECSYISNPLEQDTTILGMPRLEIYYQSIKPFAQLDPWIYEVTSEGTEILVSRGWYEGQNLTAWHMVNTKDQPIEMTGAYHHFEKGSRIKLEISTADLIMTWPYFEFNLILLSHNRRAPSRIILPVIPENN